MFASTAGPLAFTSSPPALLVVSLEFGSTAASLGGIPARLFTLFAFSRSLGCALVVNLPLEVAVMIKFTLDEFRLLAWLLS